MDPDAVGDVGHVHHGGASDADLLDFSANVNPETPDGVEEVYRDALADARRYPADDYAGFRAAAADAVDCDPGQVVPTAGGLGAIRLAVATAVGPDDVAVLPAPSFGEYAREVRLQGGEPTFVSQDELLDVEPAAVEVDGVDGDRGTHGDDAETGTDGEDAETGTDGDDTGTHGHDRSDVDDVALVIACTPNNPTGNAYDPDGLRTLAERCRHAGATLLVDEAFLGFTGRESLAGTPGAVVARSLTKLYGLPGLRAGYAVATGGRLEALRTAREPWALGTPAAAVGEHCLRDRAFVAETRDRVRSERERVRAALSERFDVRPSEAPFLLLDPGERDVDELLAAARECGVALRDARTFRGLDGHVRVAVRSPAENDRLLEALDVR